MKRRYRQSQIIIIIALVAVMLGVSVGFAAFSNVLTIGSSAQVKPDSSTFSVLFSSSGTTQATSAVSGTGSGGASGGSASISGTTISGLKANFTAPGQSVTYTFYSHNVGSFIAYLRNVNFGTGRNCLAGIDTNSDMVDAACKDISVSVTVGDSTYIEDTIVTGHGLSIGMYEKIIIKITYASNGNFADGDFSVYFGDISLIYSSVDGESAKLIEFIAGSDSLIAEEGMTFGEWIESDYNTAGIKYDDNGKIVTSDCLVLTSYEGSPTSSTVIVEMSEYSLLPSASPSRYGTCS